MGAKHYLERFEIYEKRIERDKEELARLRALASTPSIAGEIQEDKIQTSMNLHRWEDNVVNMNELNNRIAAQINSYIVQRELAKKQIESLDNELYSTVLHEYYLNGKSLKKIANAKGYTHQYIRRVHMEALKAFDNKYLR